MPNLGNPRLQLITNQGGDTRTVIANMWGNPNSNPGVVISSRYTNGQGIIFNVTGGMTLGDDGLPSDIGTSRFIVKNNGQVGIGTEADPIPSAFKLAVNGGIIATRVKVATYNSADWADYVFDEEYKLMPLEKVESFVAENKHLPDVPSAKEVEANGVDLMEMNVLLLKKVEELTLHTIAQQKEIEALKEKIK